MVDIWEGGEIEGDEGLGAWISEGDEGLED